jgi:hypothetical protein
MTTFFAVIFENDLSDITIPFIVFPAGIVVAVR